MTNPLLSLNYESAIESLGDEYYDIVQAAQFPEQILRFRNDSVLPLLGLEPQNVTNNDFIEAFGKFQRQPLLALRYHGYQFGYYNPDLGDGRGFLFGQVRGTDGELYDFGTKGSGKTPYSRGGDGRLTLKGGVREVLATEFLHQTGVRTSRTFSLVETGEQLWRGDEPSPTRSSVMVRFSNSHIRFGTFERLHHLNRPDLTQKLLDHVIEYYYPDIHNKPDQYVLFYAQLVARVAKLAAQWMAAGFCHGVLNTDNMSITGESFDYGPYAFIPSYDLEFTAAYFDHYRRYSYGNQPDVCCTNLEALQQPLAAVIDIDAMAEGLAKFYEYYQLEYKHLMLKKLGFTSPNFTQSDELLEVTIQLLKDTQIGYHDFFTQLRERFTPSWREQALIFNFGELPAELLSKWQNLYQQSLSNLPIDEMEKVAQQLQQSNPKTALLRPVIESVWESIANEDNWQPFNELVKRLQAGE